MLLPMSLAVLLLVHSWELGDATLRLISLGVGNDNFATTKKMRIY